MEPTSVVHKALIIPINKEGKIFIQDRRGYKKPDWGFFGGSIEQGETPLEAVLRETHEELDIELRPETLLFLGVFYAAWNDLERHIYLFKTDKEQFTVKEENGGCWLTLEEARDRMDSKERFDEIARKIKTVL
ncbi:MAG: NUDIX hydrolase [Candidatus Liptonbacteria bacterium]|nr:NUDIX hydrolase [Candidatus Liptonbacteria bacterium]